MKELNFRKLTQIVNYLLGKYHYRVNYTKLIKILYKCERETWSRWDITLTTDVPCSMPKGPVLSKLYDLICGRYYDQILQSEWNAYFQRDGNDILSLAGKKLPVDELSKRELHLIDQIDHENHKKTYSDLITELHDQSKYPEIERTDSSVQITPSRLLTALGRSQAEAEKIVAEAAQINKEKQFLKSRCG